jgi:mannobiose 2-epimerase
MESIQFKKEVEERILPFWLSIYDEEEGGVFGRVDFNYNIIKDANKGCIFISRVLWFLSNCIIEGVGDKDEVLSKADRTYTFLMDHCYDDDQCGIFWSVSREGSVVDSTKHTYNIAFAIYALSSYYKATGLKDALLTAFELYNLIESKCKDNNGYLESFTIDFKPLINDKLSENGVIAERTMNTLLHVLEGFTGLYEVTHDENVRKSIIEIFGIFENHIYNSDRMRQEVFFDLDYNSLLDLHSFGHDIESSWLMGWALDLIDDDKLSKRIDPLLKRLSINVLKTAVTDIGGLENECDRNIVDDTYVWWVQSEGVIGFYNAYQRWNVEGSYKAASDVFGFINTHIIDKRDGGEWFWDLDKNCNPISGKDIVEQWKCPYHNGRMCFEMMRRLKDDK